MNVDECGGKATVLPNGATIEEASGLALDGFDLRALPDAFYDDPYPTYHLLRQASPVHRLPDGGLLLTRHADVQAVYRDPRLFSSDKKREFGAKYGPSPLLEHHTTSLVFNDPPLHTRVRRTIMGALTARAIAEMEPGLVVLVDRLLDRFAERGGGDLVEGYAAAIPVEVIGNLLGVPHEERGPLRDWSLAILGALEPQLTPAQEGWGNRAVEEFTAYLRGLVADRRRQPGDPARDVLTRLLLSDDPLTEGELLQNCVFILNAGHETTTNLIANALHALLRWPDQEALLRDAVARGDPDVLRTAVDEFLRYESSNQLGNRMATADTEVGGVPVAAGTGITLCIGAANRDPDVFPDPDRLDLRREPNRHLAFGFGIHQCAGLALARLEARIATGRFLARFQRYEPAGTPVRARRVRFRGFTHLPVRAYAA